jgi:hypothetical protein
MKKKLLALAMAAAMALVVAPLALAAGDTGGNATNPTAKAKPFLAQGTVVSVSVETATMVVTLTRGSHNMKPLIRNGENVTFTLATGCHVFARTVGHHGNVHFKSATLDQVTEGSKVTINGRVYSPVTIASVFSARHIVVRLAPATTPPPAAIPSAASAF